MNKLGLTLGMTLAFATPAYAGCTCTCVNSKLVKTCTDPLDVSLCKGQCFGSGCLGLCTLDPSINEQARITAEAKANAWKLRKPRPVVIPPPTGSTKPLYPVLKYEQRI